MAGLTNEMLVFAYQRGCAACEASEAELTVFEQAHPRVTVIRIDAFGPFPPVYGLKIRETPTWLFRRDGEGVVRSGFLKAKELERWVKSLGAVL
jgi:hypothetical protein